MTAVSLATQLCGHPRRTKIARLNKDIAILSRYKEQCNLVRYQILGTIFQIATKRVNCKITILSRHRAC